MIKIENLNAVGWESAIRGMRNPLNSWDKADSVFENGVFLGNNDLSLMKKLRNAGTSDHRKFMRMIVVYMDIIAPLYWWKEFDTYKVGTVANSCSTMHTIHKKRFSVDDFSHEHLEEDKSGFITDNNGHRWFCAPTLLETTVFVLNAYRDLYLKTRDKKYWWQMIQLLPSSYNQKRTVMLNYEVLANMYKSRHNHKLDEWVEFCNYISKNLPYSHLITGESETVDDSNLPPYAFAL